jgi:hypothetical protein
VLEVDLQAPGWMGYPEIDLNNSRALAILEKLNTIA